MTTAPTLTPNTVVKADEHWNPMADAANEANDNLATEITNRSNAVAAINTRLGNNIAGGGISDLPAWKTTIDNRTTDASTGNTALGARVTANEASIATLNTRTTDASTGNTALGGRVTTVENRTTAAGSGNAALNTRVTALESAVSGGAIPVAILRNTVSQTLAHNTDTPISFTTEDVDTANGHDNATNPTRWTCPAGWAGYYEVSGGGNLNTGSGGTAGSRTATWLRNGLKFGGSEGVGSSGTATQSVQARVMIVQLAVGDYLELSVRQTSGNTMSTDVSAVEKNFTMHLHWLRGL